MPKAGLSQTRKNSLCISKKCEKSHDPVSSHDPGLHTPTAWLEIRNVIPAGYIVDQMAEVRLFLLPPPSHTATEYFLQSNSFSYNGLSKG